MATSSWEPMTVLAASAMEVLRLFPRVRPTFAIGCVPCMKMRKEIYGWA